MAFDAFAGLITARLAQVYLTDARSKLVLGVGVEPTCKGNLPISGYKPLPRAVAAEYWGEAMDSNHL